MTLDTLPELLENAETQRASLIKIWDDSKKYALQDALHLSSKPISIEAIRYASIRGVQSLFTVVDDNRLLDPDAMLKFALFEDYLKKTNFEDRATTAEDKEKAKNLLDFFIGYASKKA